MGWVVNASSRPLYPQKRPGIHCMRGWVSPMAGLDGCGKSRPYRDSIAGPFSPVAFSYQEISAHKDDVYKN